MNGLTIYSITASLYCSSVMDPKLVILVRFPLIKTPEYAPLGAITRKE